jgi:hypothetical protein
MVAIPLDAERVRPWLAIPVEELAERSPIPLTVLPSKEDVYRHFAQEIFQEAEAAAAVGEELTVIVPLGPRAHYALLARMVNEAGLSLEHVSYVGMLIHEHPDVHVVADAASAACPPSVW